MMLTLFSVTDGFILNGLSHYGSCWNIVKEGTYLDSLENIRQGKYLYLRNKYGISFIRFVWE